MSRSHYVDDFGDEFPGQVELYRANVDRSFRSRAGRARLRELLAALDAMPVRELADEVFIERREGTAARPGAPMCALGVWAATSLGEQSHGMFEDSEPDAITTADVLADYGWPKLVVYDLIHENDDPERCRWVSVAGPATRYWPWPVRYRVPETDAERWQRVRGFVANMLEEIAARDAWKKAHPFTTPSPSGVGLL